MIFGLRNIVFFFFPGMPEIVTISCKILINHGVGQFFLISLDPGHIKPPAFDKGGFLLIKHGKLRYFPANIIRYLKGLIFENWSMILISGAVSGKIHIDGYFPETCLIARGEIHEVMDGMKAISTQKWGRAMTGVAKSCPIESFYRLKRLIFAKPHSFLVHLPCWLI